MAQLAVAPIDWRVNFLGSQLTISSPIVTILKPDNLEPQLYKASFNFLTEQVKVVVGRKRVCVRLSV